MGTNYWKGVKEPCHLENNLDRGYGRAGGGHLLGPIFCSGYYNAFLYSWKSVLGGGQIFRNKYEFFLGGEVLKITFWRAFFCSGALWVARASVPPVPLRP